MPEIPPSSRLAKPPKIADAHRGNGKRFVVRADELLTAFVELERTVHEFAVSLIS